MVVIRCVGFSPRLLSRVEMETYGQHNIDNGSNNQDDRLTPPPFENETKG
jgi:hypothetical protein